MTALLLSHNPLFSPLAEVVALCRSCDCGIEMSAFSEAAAVENTALISAQLTGTRGLSPRAVHGPYLDLYPGSPDRENRSTTRRIFSLTCTAAGQLQAGHLIFHHNYDPSASSKAEWAARSVEFWQELLEGCPENLRLHLENVMDENPDLLLEIIDRCGRPNLDLALDIGHVNVYSQASLAEWINTAGPRIGYVHLHDNAGQEDNHLALGDGNIDLPAALEALKSRAPTALWSVESGGRKMYRSLDWLKRHSLL
jgi:sugar phosphate isomerase/epimerase